MRKVTTSGQYAYVASSAYGLQIYKYGLSGIDDNNDFSVEENTFTLFQNYPNPFLHSTNIRYQLKEECEVILEVYDLAGRLLNTIVNDKQKEGYHSVKWGGKTKSGSNAAGGIYFYRLKAGNSTETRKMCLLK